MTTTEQAQDELARLQAERQAFLWRVNGILYNTDPSAGDLETAELLRKEIARLDTVIQNIQRML